MCPTNSLRTRHSQGPWPTNCGPAVAVHPIAAVQSEWSIWSRDVERNVAPTAAELGVGLCHIHHSGAAS